MKKYHANDLLKMSSDELWSIPDDKHIVVFDDGELEAWGRETILSVHYWNPIRYYPLTPISKHYHVASIGFNATKIIRALERVTWGIVRHYRSLGKEVDMEHMSILIRETDCLIYNMATTKKEVIKNVTTLSAFDFIEVMRHPAIKEANDNVEPNHHSIEEVAYKKITEALKTAPELDKNPIAISVRAGTVPVGQVLQCIGPRGFTTDINSNIFKYPIMNGYFEGISTAYGKAVETRSATKATSYNKEMISDTETLNRILQLACQTVENLHPGDCGTTTTIEMPIVDDILKCLLGKYYIDEKGRERVIHGNEKHLIGKTIQMRSILGCMHPDPIGVCAKCYGKIAENIPRDTNIGHVAAYTIGDIITSIVMSTKHLDSTAHVDPFVLTDKEVKYLHKKDPTKDILYFQRLLRGKKYSIVIFSEEAPAISDLSLVRDVDCLIPKRIASMSKILIEVENEETGVMEREELQVSLYNRRASFTPFALSFIKRRGWEYINDIDGQGNAYMNSRKTASAKKYIRIDMTGFDVREAFIELPFTHVNMLEYKKEFEKFIFSGSDSSTPNFPARITRRKNEPKPKMSVTDFDNPTDALVAFLTRTNKKIFTNVVHREVVLYAMMGRDVKGGDLRLPKPGITGQFASKDEVLRGRSLSGLCAYQMQGKTIFSYSAFTNVNRPDHPLDLILTGGVELRSTTY